MIEKIGGRVDNTVSFSKRHGASVNADKNEDRSEKADSAFVSAPPEAWQANTGIFKRAAKRLDGALYYAQTRLQDHDEEMNNAILESLIPYGKDTMRCYKYYANQYRRYPEALALINCIASTDPKMLTESPYIDGFAQIIKNVKGHYYNRFDLDSSTLEMFRLIDTKDEATISGETPGRWVGTREGIAFAVFDTIIRNTDVSAKDKCEWLCDASEKLREKTDLDLCDFRKFAQGILKEYNDFAEQQ